MNARKTAEPGAADEAALRAFPQQMIAAWNKGDAEAFAASFGEDADFVAFEGTRLKGRKEIAAFHQQAFAKSVKGTRLEGEAKFVHFLTPQLAVMHATARVVLPGQTQSSPSRDSMQLFVAMKSAGVWHTEAMLNARQLSIERQLFLDDLDALPMDARQQVTELVASLKQRTSR